MDELKDSIKRAVAVSETWQEQKIRLEAIARIYELSFRQVVALASSWFGEDYKKKIYVKKSLKSKEELVCEIAEKLELDLDLCDSLTKVNKGILVRILERL